MGPSYRFKRKDKSVPSSARIGVGECAKVTAGSRNVEMSTANFMVVVVGVGGGGGDGE